jgi:hypothetical protein
MPSTSKIEPEQLRSTDIDNAKVLAKIIHLGKRR